jgi:cell division protein FtsL
MRTIFLKDSSNRKKQFALTTRICVENDKKVVIKEPCYPEGLSHINRIAESQQLFAKYYKNVELSKTWIENNLLYAEFIDGIPLSDFYNNAIKNNDKDEIIRLFKYHLELALGRNNTCIFRTTESFENVFGRTNSFEGETALNFTFFDPLPENIIFINGDINRPCFIDYEWFFDFPVPVSFLKFRIAQQFSLLPGMDVIIPLVERLKYFNCFLSINEGIAYYYQFSDFVFKEKAVNYSYQNQNKHFEKNILQYPEIIIQNCILYFNTGNGYSEDKKYNYTFSGNQVEISCQVPENIHAVRLDPIEGYGCVISDLEILSYGGIIKYEPLDGWKNESGDIIFTNTDPMIEITGAINWLKIKYRILILSEFSHYRVLNNYITVYKELKELIAERDCLISERNVLETERDTLITEQNNLAVKYACLSPQNCSLFFDTGYGYSEKEKQDYTYKGNEVEINCHVPENTFNIRFDPVEGYGCIISDLEIISHNGIVKFEPINGYNNEIGDMVFTNTDPQIKIQAVSYWLKIKYRIQFLSEFSQFRLLDSYIATCHERNSLIKERDGLIAERDGLVTERNGLIAEHDGLVNERNGLIAERDGLVNERNGLIAERDWLAAEQYALTTERNSLVIERNGLLNSRSWRITKPLRNMGVFIRRNKVLHFFAKGLLSLKRKVIKGTIKTYNNPKSHLQEQWSALGTETPIYESEYQNNIDFSGFEPKVKAIAFYLPQFHSIPENDKWWGKGFTEWSNTRKAKPRFTGHYQPREPHKDIGYYNLANFETFKKQVRLARQHGIYGFCFYLYWFSGKRLLEKPLDLLIAHPEIDINFCLCWANENWTRRWDGLEQEILIKQEYSDDDPYKFIEDMKKYMVDKRYIRINGAPIILVYYPGHIPNIKEVFLNWKKHANDIGIGNISIWICNTWGHTAETLNIKNVVDGIVEFPPHNMQNNALYYDKDIATICSYESLVSEIKNEIDKEDNSLKTNSTPLYHTCMMGWDNSARKKNAWINFIRFSLNSLFNWASMLVTDAIKNKKEVFFINAWNEWGEGTYLEPDKKYGYANINTISKAIYGIPFKEESDEYLPK